MIRKIQTQNHLASFFHNLSFGSTAKQITCAILKWWDDKTLTELNCIRHDPIWTGFSVNPSTQLKYGSNYSINLWILNLSTRCIKSWTWKTTFLTIHCNIQRKTVDELSHDQYWSILWNMLHLKFTKFHTKGEKKQKNWLFLLNKL